MEVTYRYFTPPRSIFLSVANSCDIGHLKMHKYHGSENSLQIHILHVQ